MRTFKCAQCGHEWQLPHGVGGMGSSLKCPECSSPNVHRAPQDRGWSRCNRAPAASGSVAAGTCGCERGRERGQERRAGARLHNP